MTTVSPLSLRCRDAFKGLSLAVVLSAATAGTSLAVEPIFTRSAQTVESLTVNANFKYFEDVQLEEADRFDGYGFDFEVMVPFRHNMQIRLVLPAYTKGTARLIDPPTMERIDIKGPSGTFDYPTILLDHQLRNTGEHGYNFAYFIGYGKSIGPWGKLDTTHGDTYNHQGDLVRLGVQADRLSDDGSIHWFGNFGTRSYFGSDDLNPAQTGDTFHLVEVTGAAVFHDLHEWVLPALEMSLVTDVDRYHALHVIPQVILPFNDQVRLKAGVPLRIGNDGEKWSFRLQLSAQL